MPNRYICTVLDEMRALDKTRNYGSLLGMIEELQVMANRMEAALYDKNDLDRARKKYTKIKEEIKELKLKNPDLKEKE